MIKLAREVQAAVKHKKLGPGAPHLLLLTVLSSTDILRKLSTQSCELSTTARRSSCRATRAFESRSTRNSPSSAKTTGTDKLAQATTGAGPTSASIGRSRSCRRPTRSCSRTECSKSSCRRRWGRSHPNGFASSSAVTWCVTAPPPLFRKWRTSEADGFASTDRRWRRFPSSRSSFTVRLVDPDALKVL